MIEIYAILISFTMSLGVIVACLVLLALLTDVFSRKEKTYIKKIYCKERMPTENKRYLAKWETGRITELEYSVENKGFNSQYDMEDEIKCIWWAELEELHED